MQFIFNRNSILILAVILGLVVGDFAHYLQPFTFLALAVTMAFSMTGIGMQTLLKPQKLVKPMFVGAVLNYLVFGLIINTLA